MWLKVPTINYIVRVNCLAWPNVPDKWTHSCEAQNSKGLEVISQEPINDQTFFWNVQVLNTLDLMSQSFPAYAYFITQSKESKFCTQYLYISQIGQFKFEAIILSHIWKLFFSPFWMKFMYLLSTSIRFYTNEMLCYCCITQHLKILESGIGFC